MLPRVLGTLRSCRTVAMPSRSRSRRWASRISPLAPFAHAVVDCGSSAKNPGDLADPPGPPLLLDLLLVLGGSTFVFLLRRDSAGAMVDRDRRRKRYRRNGRQGGGGRGGRHCRLRSTNGPGGLGGPTGRAGDRSGGAVPPRLGRGRQRGVARCTRVGTPERHQLRRHPDGSASICHGLSPWGSRLAISTRCGGWSPSGPSLADGPCGQEDANANGLMPRSLRPTQRTC